MKVIHLASGNLESGAGQGARWLHSALRRLNVDSELLASRQPLGSAEQEGKVWGVSKLKLQLLSRLDTLPLRAARSRPVRNFSCGFAGINLRRLIAQTKPDILHLHFINTGYVSIRSLADLGIPIVWTLRDMWPFTGGCHYTWDCMSYTKECGACPTLESTNQNDLSKRIWKRKEGVYSRLTNFYPVGISPWMQKCAQNSSLFANRKVRMIWNGVDLDNFEPIDRNQSRLMLGLPTDRPILLIGASRASSVLKGYDKLLVKLAELRKSCVFEVVRFGHVSSGGERPSWLRDMGYVSDRKKLNMIYAAADAFLAPSPQEAFGKTIVEALASGTPSVVFDGSGSEDIIRASGTGVVVSQGDFGGFAQASIDMAKALRSNQQVREVCVSRSAEFSDIECAKSYQKLYQEILSG